MSKGVIYILTNPSFPQYVKSGYSKSVTSDDDILDYIPTQFVAEYAKRLGYDGIAFRSSLTPELEDQDIHEHTNLDRYNIVVFNYHKLIFPLNIQA